MRNQSKAGGLRKLKDLAKVVLIFTYLAWTTTYAHAGVASCYGRRYLEIDISGFVIRQISPRIPRSHPGNGVAEFLAKSKQDLLPMIVFAPEILCGVVAVYLGRRPAEAAQTHVSFRGQ